jgi:hypothetical protein
MRVTQSTRSRRTSRTVQVIIASLVVLAGLIAGSGPVAAAGPSYIYTQPGAPAAIALCQSDCGTVGTPVFPSNGVSATMHCWVDAGNHTGNYTSNRYFHVAIQGMPGKWFIHSSYVYYQTTVGRCG